VIIHAGLDLPAPASIGEQQRAESGQTAGNVTIVIAAELKLPLDNPALSLGHEKMFQTSEARRRSSFACIMTSGV
jgi:hypothetical protein